MPVFSTRPQKPQLIFVLGAGLLALYLFMLAVCGFCG